MASLTRLRTEAAHCTRCALYANATQTVFGEGPRRARVMMVGEQPGDQEDRQGLPFVGPAGRLLERALDAAGIDRRDVYVTNAVKHFKWEPRGKRRLHVKPSAGEVAACRPWLDGELAAVRPELLVCLGAVAAQALLGRSFRVTQQRGVLLPSELAPRVLATVHPSSVLRAPDQAARKRAFDDFVADLGPVAAHLARAVGVHARQPRQTERARTPTAARETVRPQSRRPAAPSESPGEAAAPTARRRGGYNRAAKRRVKR